MIKFILNYLIISKIDFKDRRFKKTNICKKLNCYRVTK